MVELVGVMEMAEVVKVMATVWVKGLMGMVGLMTVMRVVEMVDWLSDGDGGGDGLLEMAVISLREAVGLVVERGRRYLCLNMCDAERVGKSFPY